MRQFSTFRVLLFGLLCALGSAAAQAQVLDPSFRPTILATPLTASQQQGVNALAVQPDGKVLAAGGFDFVNGLLTGKLQRFNTDGQPDATFNPGGSGANGFIAAIALQPDGKILIAGVFSGFNNQATPLVVRLNPNGTVDPGFAYGSAYSVRQITCLALQPDGKILVGSGSGTIFSGPFTSGLERLNPNGTVDSSFTVGSGIDGEMPINTVLVQADGRILVGGSFGRFDGQPISRLVRLTSTGAIDPGFSGRFSVNSSASVLALAQQPDGKLLVAGSFTELNGQQASAIARLLPNGTTDNTFQPGAGPNGTVRSLALDPSGNILIGGSFTAVGGVSRGRLARLTPGGGLDSGYGNPTGANGMINAVALASAGKVLVGGSFTRYGITASSGGLVQLGGSQGAFDIGFAPIVEARGTLDQAVPLPGGKLMVAGNFRLMNGQTAPGAISQARRINADGTLDASFVAQQGIAGTIQAVQPNSSFYLIDFSTLTRVLASGAVDNSFVVQAFGPTSGTNSTRLQGAVALPTGQILVFGRFSSYGSLNGLNGIVRLNPDGTPDNTAFVPGSGATGRRVLQLFVQPSGKVISLSENDFSAPLTSTLLRYSANGVPDNTFSSGVPGASYQGLMQPDGRLLISGRPTSINNGPLTPAFLMRLTADGAADPSFSAPSNTYMLKAVQADGRALALGYDTWLANAMVRLNLDGSLDTSFNPVSTPESYFSGDDKVIGVLVQPNDGKIILFGSFRYVAGQVRIGLARLTNVGLSTRPGAATLPLALYPNPAREAVTIQLPAAPQPRPATLLDLNGRRVRRWTVPALQSEIRLPLEHVAAGMYLLQVRGIEAMYQQKVVVTP